ncbi:MAG TPA: FliH/SctL family protein [Terracidiphilus sp.]|nr:FliH/SctL family protein [Terracidiphilus sp.]
MSGFVGRAETADRLEPFPYLPSSEPSPPCISWDLPRVDAEGRLLTMESAEAAGEPAAREDLERRLDDESRRSFAAGRERGIEEGRAAERALHVPAEQHRAEELRGMLEDFAAERDRYFHSAEHEIVRLALAIAARILRREAQMDPLLLMGAVRVALGQLAAAAEVRLHVPAADADLWKESIMLLPNPPVRPVVIAERDLRLGECRLEASLGRVDLGLPAQLEEIERAFHELAIASAEPAVSEGPRS